jgi:hypothetical protein
VKYETYCIEGAAEPPYNVRPDTESQCEEMSTFYLSVAERGGRIVAAHNLLCDIQHPKREDTTTKVHCLFLVAEYPHLEDNT